MCIIAYKPKGKGLKLKHLERCFENNPDGAGFMYSDGSKVWGVKGIMTYPELVQTLHNFGFLWKAKVKADLNIAFHFRIATHGGISPGNCHPFPVSSRKDDLKALAFSTDLGFAHNGILSGMADPTDPTLSDTQVFIRDIMADPIIKDNLHVQAIQGLIAGATLGSKVMVMYPDGTVLTWGDWLNIHGVMYSNNSYLKEFLIYGHSSYWSEKKEDCKKEWWQKYLSTKNGYEDKYEDYVRDSAGEWVPRAELDKLANDDGPEPTCCDNCVDCTLEVCVMGDACSGDCDNCTMYHCEWHPLKGQVRGFDTPPDYCDCDCITCVRQTCLKEFVDS